MRPASEKPKEGSDCERAEAAEAYILGWRGGGTGAEERHAARRLQRVCALLAGIVLVLSLGVTMDAAWTLPRRVPWRALGAPPAERVLQLPRAATRPEYAPTCCSVLPTSVRGAAGAAAAMSRHRPRAPPRARQTRAHPRTAPRTTTRSALATTMPMRATARRPWRGTRTRSSPATPARASS